jgi:DNA-binding response OmpR family regulator
LKPVLSQDYEDANIPDHNNIKEYVEASAALGKFLFNVKGQHLLLESEVIPLTDKECKVLQLLHNNFGQLMPRETLMQEVWINEGVITGRSLDMFVSKLRKKLSRDPELRITNIHGKGYKLEIPGENS